MIEVRSSSLPPKIVSGLISGQPKVAHALAGGRGSFRVTTQIGLDVRGHKMPRSFLFPGFSFVDLLALCGGRFGKMSHHQSGQPFAPAHPLN